MRSLQSPHGDRTIQHLDFRLALLFVCVQLWLIATSSRRLHPPGETLGSVARGGIVSDAARGDPQVALTPFDSMSREQISTFAVLCSSEVDSQG